MQDSRIPPLKNISLLIMFLSKGFLKIEGTLMPSSPTSFSRTFLWYILGLVGLMIEPTVSSSAEVAVIKSQDILPYNQAVEGFRSLTQLEVKEYDMKGDIEEGLRIINQVKRLKPAAVLAVGSKAAVLAKENLSEIPLVYCIVIDPEKYGLQTSNVTGIALEIPVDTQLKTFKAVVPTLKRIGVVYDPAKTSGLVHTAQEAARQLGLELVAVEVSSAKDLPETIRGLLPKVQGLWMVPDSTVITSDSFQFILLATMERNIPFMAFSDSFVKAGALLALSPNYFAIGRQSSLLVDKVIQNGIPERRHVFHPETARLTINLKTAKILGLEISQGVLSTADEVFQ